VTPPALNRYARQQRLFEVGAAGQARIQAGSVLVRGTDLAAEQCALYLAAAGLANVRVESSALEFELHALRTDLAETRQVAAINVNPASNATSDQALPADPVAAAVYAGSIAALRVLRELVEPA
jgi:molybdopterin/thiamine biosynthesis adenylyltransferase